MYWSLYAFPLFVYLDIVKVSFVGGLLVFGILNPIVDGGLAGIKLGLNNPLSHIPIA